MRCRLILSSPPSLLQDGGDVGTFRKRLLAALGEADVAAFLLRVDPATAMAGEPALRAALAELCPPVQKAGVAFLVEGRADLAVEQGCDGVQVPANLTTVQSVRRALGPDAIVGALCSSGAGDVRHNAMEVAEAGADYIGFPAGELDTLAWWAELMEVPCVAWDAEPAQAEALAETGVEFLALAPALWDEAAPGEVLARVQSAIG